ncbi:MAG: type VI secretion system tip protein VgrG, partial [Halarcobacter sp.]
KRGDELLSLRAQKDYSLLALNDEYKHIQNNSKTIIDNDKEETIANDSTLTVGNNLNENIKFNHISTVEKEKVSTVQEDYELHVLKDFNTIVKKDFKQILENDMKLTIKETLLEYVEQDVSDKYLESFFIQIGDDLGIDIRDGFHINTEDILYEASKEINLDGANGISLKCGANILTVDSSGIHFNTANFKDNSAFDGLEATEVIHEGDIINPRITNHYSTAISKQLEEILYIEADTTLKDGRSVNITLKALDRDGEVIAQETKTATVKNTKISQEFDTKKLKQDNKLEEDSIKKYTGVINV